MGGGERLRLKRRETLLLGLLAVVAVVAVWPRLGAHGAAPAVLSRAPRAASALPPVPRIGLDRLEKDRDEVPVGRRDLFAYGPRERASSSPRTEPTPAIRRAAPTPAPTSAGDSIAATRLPPLSLKYIGAVGNSAGVKVAVLLTSHNEVLTGRPGDVVANRYRIVKIGLESVDLEDVGTGQPRRLPLNGS